MALTTTTNSSAIGAGDKQIVVASATGFAAGNLCRVDNEIMRVSKAYVSGTTILLDGRGLDGTAQVAHPVSTNVTTGLATDFPVPAPGGPFNAYAAQPAVDVAYYSAAGAITLPTAGRWMLAVINGTGALAMTLASPTKEMDGSVLFITNGGKAAHTVTLTAGFGANTTNSDVLTFNANQSQAIVCVAANGVWNLVGVVAGAASVAGVGLG
jgi:hypothetical protein